MVWLNCGNSKGIIHIARRPWVFNACRPYMKSIREESLGFIIQDRPAWQTCCLSHLFMGRCFWGTWICNLQYDAYILVQRESLLLFFSYIMMVSHGFEKKCMTWKRGREQDNMWGKSNGDQTALENFRKQTSAGLVKTTLSTFIQNLSITMNLFALKLDMVFIINGVLVEEREITNRIWRKEWIIDPQLRLLAKM